MREERTQLHAGALVSIAIFAWNEEDAIKPTIKSLFQQSFFARLTQRGHGCEVIAVLNGCTDGTARVAAEQFQEANVYAGCTTRVADLAVRGKMNAWNTFVHELSDKQASVLMMMDADICIHRPDTLWNMLRVLEQDTSATVVVDLPVKGIAGQKSQWLRRSLSRGMAAMTRASQAQLCGQLYGIRAEIARKIYIPKDLSACEDGFLKMMVCTDLLTHEVWPQRIRLAPDAGHIFEAYTSISAILRNQKRQVIGQTIVHLLVDKYLQALPMDQRPGLAAYLRAKDNTEHDWLKQLIATHVAGVKFWQLYPGLFRQHLARLRNVRGFRRLLCLPAAIAGLFASSVASWMGYRTLKSGTINYWPKAQRTGFNTSGPALNRPAQLPVNP